MHQMRGLERDLALLKALETDVWIIARLHEGLHKADAIMRRCKQAMEETQLLLNSVGPHARTRVPTAGEQG